MSDVVEVRVPDIGDFEGVEVVELLVGPGDVVEVDDGLISIESEKATMEIPAPAAGTIQSIHVALGDSVSEGSLIAGESSVFIQDHVRPLRYARQDLSLGEEF